MLQDSILVPPAKVNIPFFLKYFITEDGAERLSPNIGMKLPFYAA